MGEKGNALGDEATLEGIGNPLGALDALPLDALRGSPELVNAWLDTYLKAREVREVRKASKAAEEAAAAAAAAADAVAAGDSSNDQPSASDPEHPPASN